MTLKQSSIPLSNKLKTSIQKSFNPPDNREKNQ